MNAAPLLYAAVAAGGLASRRSATLSFPRLYLAFTLAVGISSPILLKTPAAFYYGAYVALQLIHNALLCMMALEVVSVLVPPRFTQFWGTCFLLIFGLAAVRHWPAFHNAAGWLNLTVSADLTAGLLLMALVLVPDLRWTREHALTAAGIAAVLLSDALPSIRLLQGYVQGMAPVLQFGPLAGLVLLCVAGFRQSWKVRTQSP